MCHIYKTTVTESNYYLFYFLPVVSGNYFIYFIYFILGVMTPNAIIIYFIAVSPDAEFYFIYYFFIFIFLFYK